MKITFIANIYNDHTDNYNVIVYADSLEEATYALQDYDFTVVNIEEFNTFEHGDPRYYECIE